MYVLASPEKMTIKSILKLFVEVKRFMFVPLVSLKLYTVAVML